MTKERTMTKWRATATWQCFGTIGDIEAQLCGNKATLSSQSSNNYFCFHLLIFTYIATDGSRFTRLTD